MSLEVGIFLAIGACVLFALGLAHFIKRKTGMVLSKKEEHARKNIEGEAVYYWDYVPSQPMRLMVYVVSVAAVLGFLGVAVFTDTPKPVLFIFSFFMMFLLVTMVQQAQRLRPAWYRVTTQGIWRGYYGFQADKASGKLEKENDEVRILSADNIHSFIRKPGYLIVKLKHAEGIDKKRKSSLAVQMTPPELVKCMIYFGKADQRTGQFMENWLKETSERVERERRGIPTAAANTF